MFGAFWFDVMVAIRRKLAFCVRWSGKTRPQDETSLLVWKNVDRGFQEQTDDFLTESTSPSF